MPTQSLLLAAHQSQKTSCQSNKIWHDRPIFVDKKPDNQLISDQLVSEVLFLTLQAVLILLRETLPMDYK